MAEVQKSAFLLSSATLMVGRAFVDDVFALTPDQHSVGVAQEVRVVVDSSRTELANGPSQSVVDSRRSNVRSSITGNVFEYTAQNFLRAQGFSRSPVQPQRGHLTVALTGGELTISITSDPLPGESTSALTAIPAGASLLIVGQNDLVFPTKTSGVSNLNGGVHTVPVDAAFQIPAGWSFPAGSYVWVVEEIGVGAVAEDDLFCVKVVGTLSNFDRPVVYMAPKVRMVKGFEIAFSETQYGSMPWEMSPLLLSKSEILSIPRLAEVGLKRSGLVYVASGGSDESAAPANALTSPLDGRVLLSPIDGRILLRAS